MKLLRLYFFLIVLVLAGVAIVNLATGNPGAAFIWFLLAVIVLLVGLELTRHWPPR